MSNPQYHQNNQSTGQIAINSLAKLLTDNHIDIRGFCIQLKDSWELFNDDVLLTIISNKNKQENHVLFLNLVKNLISVIIIKKRS